MEPHAACIAPVEAGQLHHIVEVRKVSTFRHRAAIDLMQHSKGFSDVVDDELAHVHVKLEMGVTRQRHQFSNIRILNVRLVDIISIDDENMNALIPTVLRTLKPLMGKL